MKLKSRCHIELKKRKEKKSFSDLSIQFSFEGDLKHRYFSVP